MNKKQYDPLGLLRVRLWEELNKYNEDGTHKFDGELVKGYDLGRRDFAIELWNLIKEKDSE